MSINHFSSRFETEDRTMRIEGVSNNNLTAPGQVCRKPHLQSAADENARNTETTSGSRALIPVSPARAVAPSQSLISQPANFLAHLIATKQALPQTRERRR